MGAAAAGPVHAGQARAHRGNRAARPEHDPADSSAHAVPVAWRADVASARAGGCSMTRASNASSARVARSKGVPFSKNPVLAVRLPVWRSRVVLFVLFAAFAGLAARALWLQGLSTQFLQKQVEIRYSRTLDLPATRGKITDRDGQVLASSVPVKAIWAIPDDVQEAPPEKLKALAKLLDMSDDELKKKLDSDRGFVYLKRQVEQDVADQITKLGIDGIQTRKEYKRFYPQGEVATHVVGFTNVEDAGQEAMELAQQKTLVGMPGSRRVIKDRLGHIVEDIESVREPHDGKDLTLSIDSKIQYIAFTQLKDAVEKFHAKAGAAVVLDVRTGEVLALANWPSYNPNDRSTLTGEQLRNSARPTVNGLSEEPGSKVSVMTRLRSCSPVSVLRSFGLYDGQLASASTSPVRTSSTTAAPALAWNFSTASFSWVKAMYWILLSMDSVKSLPSCGSRTDSMSSTMWPRRSLITRRLPGAPTSVFCCASSIASWPASSTLVKPTTWVATSPCG